MYSSNLAPGTVKQEKSGKLTIDINDVPPIPREDWTPPLNNYVWHVNFYYSYALNEKSFWLNEGILWQRRINDFSPSSDAIRAAADSIVAHNDSEETKARKLYDAVMKFENTDFTRSKTDAEREAEKIYPSKTVEDV
jgi:hypothetical protein